MEAKVIIDRMINRSEADKLSNLISIWLKPNINRYMKLDVDGKEIELFYSIRKQYFIIKGDINSINKIFRQLIPITRIDIKVQFYPEKTYDYTDLINLIIRFYPRKHAIMHAVDKAIAYLTNDVKIDVTNELKNLLVRVKKFKLIDTRVLYFVFNTLKTFNVLGRRFVYANVGLMTKIDEFYYMFINERQLDQKELNLMKLRQIIARYSKNT